MVDETAPPATEANNRNKERFMSEILIGDGSVHNFPSPIARGSHRGKFENLQAFILKLC